MRTPPGSYGAPRLSRPRRITVARAPRRGGCARPRVGTSVATTGAVRVWGAAARQTGKLSSGFADGGRTQGLTPNGYHRELQGCRAISQPARSHSPRPGAQSQELRFGSQIWVADLGRRTQIWVADLGRRTGANLSQRRASATSSPPPRPRSWCAAGLVHGYVWLTACIHKAKKHTCPTNPR
jgi:hypothetical protein